MLSSLELQGFLNQKLGLTGRNALVVDGVFGAKSSSAMDKLFVQEKLGEEAENWALARQVVALEQLVLRDAQLEVGEIDGIVGPATRYARGAYRAQKLPAGTISVINFKESELGTAVKETEQGQVWPPQRTMEKFYGKPGTGLVVMPMPFPLRIAWDPAKTVQRVSVHSKCEGAFTRVWKRTLEHYGYAQLKKLRLDMFGGCLASPPRLMRGGSRGSTHNYACAWDVDPDRNQLQWGRDKASLDAEEYKAFWSIVRGEGGLSLGSSKNFDWMHFQFTKDFS